MGYPFTDIPLLLFFNKLGDSSLMQFTLTPFRTILKTGIAENTPLASRIIDEIWRKFNVRVVCFKVQDSTHLIIPPKTSIEKLIKSNRIEFVQEAILRFYIHSIKSNLPADMEALKKELQDFFFNFLSDNGVSFDYKRLYEPDEMSYYGWYNTRKSDWDTTKIIPTKPTTLKREYTFIEKIDTLALWHYMSDTLKKANNCEIAKYYGAQVYITFRKGVSTYIAIIPKVIIRDMNRSAFAKEFAAYMTSVLKPLDVWDIVSPKTMTPIVTTWDALSPEERFCILRN